MLSPGWATGAGKSPDENPAEQDTVNAALEFVASRRRRIEQLLDDPYALGVGPDIGDPEIMRAARR